MRECWCRLVAALRRAVRCWWCVLLLILLVLGLIVPELVKPDHVPGWVFTGSVRPSASEEWFLQNNGRI